MTTLLLMGWFNFKLKHFLISTLFAFYNLYIRSCGFNLLVWLLVMHC